MTGIDVRRAADRFLTVAEGRRTWHSFSFGPHYDPANTGLGALVCHNEDLLEPGSGYPPHGHRDLEIVTWVLAGALRHEDSLGHRGLVGPGWVQRTSAGDGVVHSEVAGDAPTRSVQVWALPDAPGGPPAHDLVEAVVGTGGWVALASGLSRYAGDAAVSLRSSTSAFLVARLEGGGSATLPDAPWLHLFVADGSVELEGAGVLGTGDAARLTDTGGRRVTARTGAEVLVWELHRRPGT